jgi:hypothetical protein
MGSLKTLEGSRASRLRLSLSTNRVLEMLSKQPGSSVLTLLLLRFLGDREEGTALPLETQDSLVCFGSHTRTGPPGFETN